ncbi:MAG: dihydrofolate reductase [Treponema sp.]|nr:dihydrofolate reductase [Treponema sp.]
MISLLVAYTKNKRVIGAQGKIPWNLSSERNRFKQICRDKYVIMGRKSYEEIGHPLSYCSLVIVSRQWIASPAARNDGIHFCSSLEDAVSYCRSQGQEEILIAGGGSIYEQALPYANKIYATEIEADFEGDVFFPELGDGWTGTVDETHEENGIVYRYMTYRHCEHEVRGNPEL